MAKIKINAVAKEEISVCLSLTTAPVLVSEIAFSTRLRARSRTGLFSGETKLLIVKPNSSISLEACLRKGYLAKSSLVKLAICTCKMGHYSVSILGAKKKVSLPSLVCWKSILTGISVENSNVAMSLVAEAALMISER